MADRADNEHADRALTAVLAEYTFVSGLIPFYRGVEIRALSALGLSVGAITTVFVALSEQRGANIAALSGILGLTTWIFVLFATIEVTASLRIKRASTYIQNYLYPLITAIAPPANLQWESMKSADLIGVPEPVRLGQLRNRLRMNLVTSGPLSLGIGVAGFLVGVIAIVLLFTSDRADLGVFFVVLYTCAAGLGGLVSGGLGIYGFRLTHSVERNTPPEQTSR
jgi:hypothetical protein